MAAAGLGRVQGVTVPKRHKVVQGGHLRVSEGMRESQERMHVDVKGAQKCSIGWGDAQGTRVYERCSMGQVQEDVKGAQKCSMDWGSCIRRQGCMRRATQVKKGR